MRPLILDLFCCEGGAAMGYYRAGFDVIGVDIVARPKYPFLFIQADALAPPVNLSAFDAIHASPPCQAFSSATRNDLDYPNLVDPTRQMLMSSGLPWVIENVPGAPMNAPHSLFDPSESLITLCGSMFDELLPRLHRHRMFESNVPLRSPGRCRHDLTRDVLSVVGHGEQGESHRRGEYWGIEARRQAMGIDWTSREGLSEAIPPTYTEHIGEQMMEALR
jgi:DNA (cytosine-5)-methyltransferase 1